MRQKPEPRFNDQVLFRCPESLPLALAEAADRQMMTVSQYVRGAVMKQLQLDGIDPHAPGISK